MTRILFTSTENITLIGGGPLPADALTCALARAPRLIAADGGADRVIAMGHKPSAVIGDMDSLSKVENWRNSDVEIFKIDEQDTTDFEKCLYSVDAPLFLGVGFLGGRTDHLLASLNTLVRWQEKPVVLLGEEDVVFAAGTDLDLDLPEGTRVSFFPLTAVRGGRSEGLHWPLDGLDLAPDGRVGTSNVTTGGRMRVAFDRAGVIASLPRAALDAAIAAVSSRGR